MDLKYSKAIKRLEEIVQKIESEEIDVDDLSARVKEAVELLRVCRGKIEKAEMEIKNVVNDLDDEISANGDEGEFVDERGRVVDPVEECDELRSIHVGKPQHISHQLLTTVGKPGARDGEETVRQHVGHAFADRRQV